MRWEPQQGHSCLFRWRSPSRQLSAPHRRLLAHRRLEDIKLCGTEYGPRRIHQTALALIDGADVRRTCGARRAVEERVVRGDSGHQCPALFIAQRVGAFLQPGAQARDHLAARPAAFVHLPLLELLLTEQGLEGGLLFRLCREVCLPAFRIRLVLAATLGASYGIYSSFEIGENRPMAPGSEEYFESEKYQIRQWPFASAPQIQDLIRQVNLVRRVHPALQFDRTLRFHLTTSDDVIAYSKTAGTAQVLSVVSLDPTAPREAFVCLALPDEPVDDREVYPVRDLLTDQVYTWRGAWNFVRLDPELPAHILDVQRARAPRTDRPPS